MKIAVGSDHAGYEDPPPHYKPELIAHLGVKGHDVTNCGTDSSEAVDYPDVAEEVCAKVLHGEADLGVLICGTGIGMSMAANRHTGIRAAVCPSTEHARLGRAHNDANVLCLGARLTPAALAEEILSIFVATPFEGGRHQIRVSKLTP